MYSFSNTPIVFSVEQLYTIVSTHAYFMLFDCIFLCCIGMRFKKTVLLFALLCVHVFNISVWKFTLHFYIFNNFIAFSLLKCYVFVCLLEYHIKMFVFVRLQECLLLLFVIEMYCCLVKYALFMIHE